MSDDNITAECSKFLDNPGNCRVIIRCKYAACALSIIGSLIVLSLTCVLKKYKQFKYRLIAYLSLASFVLSIAFIPYDFNTEQTGPCIAQGVVIEFCIIAVVYWVNVLAINLYVSTFHSGSLKRLEIPFVILGIVIPCVFFAVPLIADTHIYGPAGPWCWMVGKWQWRFGTWYFWRFLTLLVMILIVCRVVYHLQVILKKRHSGEATDNVRDDIRTQSMYPVVFFLVNMFPTINRIQNAADPNNPVFALYLLQALSDPLFGAVIAIVFVLDGETRRSLKDAFGDKTGGKQSSTTSDIEKEGQDQETGSP